MRFFFMLQFSGLIFSSCNAQALWNDEVIFNKSSFEEEIWVLDSCLAHADSFSIGLTKIESVYSLIALMKKIPSLEAEILVLMNSNYDTLSSLHPIRLKAQSIARDLECFNISKKRFQIKDSLVSDFDLLHGKQEAYRKVIVKLRQSKLQEGLLKQLLNSQGQAESMRLFFEKRMTAQKNNANTTKTFASTLPQYKIDQLIDLFYDKFYVHQVDEKYVVLPQTYEVEIGEVLFSITAEDRVDEAFYISADTSLFMWQGASYLIEYQYLIRADNILYLDTPFRQALTEFLGYSFSFSRDTFSNIPSNIYPIDSTKRRLQQLSSFFTPRYDWVSNDACNGFVFWDFKWFFQSPLTIKKISIDEESKEAFITFFDQGFNEAFARFMLIEEDWVFKKTLQDKQVSYHIYGILFIVMLTSVILIALRNLN